MGTASDGDPYPQRSPPRLRARADFVHPHRSASPRDEMSNDLPHQSVQPRTHLQVARALPRCQTSRMSHAITIVPFCASLAPAFAALNRAWIEQFFSMEESDWKLLRDPQSAIVDTGGAIFFALAGDTVVGTVAAIRINEHTHELGKMAVTPTYQGQGIGDQLGRAVIAWARNMKVRRLLLETNRKLEGAIRLYERLGFVHKMRPTPSEYARADVYMELELFAEIPDQ